MKEIWKEIPQSIYWLGFKPMYEASNFGRVRNKKTGKILSYSPSNRNFNRLRVQLQATYPGGRLSFLVSHIIYSTFVGNCYGKHVKFKDGTTSNFNVSNLYL